MRPGVSLRSLNRAVSFFRGVRLLLLLVLLLPLSDPASARRVPPAAEYGRVVLDNFSKKAGMAPVVFDHWLHRAFFTCRLCHVDIGFGMKAGTTKVSRSLNQQGLYCGTCHNGKTVFRGQEIFAACSDGVPEKTGTCDRCHSKGRQVRRMYRFEEFAGALPGKGMGNGIDWEGAAEGGIISPADTVEGIPMKKSPLRMEKEIPIESRGTWMTDVLFSHRKHAAWNGCEVCHPELFEVKKGARRYSMFQIAEGEFCGVCHDKVAFPLAECQRCHIKPVQ